MKKYLVYFFLCIQNLTFLYAQADTKFWFAAPEVTALHADRPIFLQIASLSKETNVTISQPANIAFKPIQIALKANQFESIDLTNFIDQIENSNVDTITNKGLLIESTEEITVYYEVKGTSGGNVNNTDLFALKGSNALGLEFYLPFQYLKPNNLNHYGKDGWSAADLVATEDNTIITITPKQNAVGHLANETFQITLNKGQTYSLRAEGQSINDRLFGTKITSNKPIAVTIKDDSVTENQTDRFPPSDLIGDQLIPTNIIGTQYILGDGTVYLLATKNNTKITLSDLTLGGLSSETLQEGEQIAIVLDENPVFIESTEPIYVLHVIELNGEYGGAIVPPIQCTGSQKVSFVRQSGNGFELTVLIKKGGEDSFFVNGKKSASLVKDIFKEVPNTNGVWLYANRDLFELKEGEVNTIENKAREFHLGIKTKTNGGSSYGYFSNFGNLDLGVDVNVCQGDSITLSAGEGRDTYLWSTGAKTSTIEIPSEKTIEDLLIWVKITEGQCKAEDTVFVNIGEAVKGVELGANQEICEGDSVMINLPSNYLYEWNSGSNESNYSVKKEGWHIVTVKSKDGCELKDSLELKVVLLPKINLGNDTLICPNTTLTLNIPSNYETLWSTGTKDHSIMIEKEGTYSVKVMTQTKAKICGTDESEITVGFWNVHTYNVLTPNEDGRNDVFVVDGIEKGDWQLEVYNRWGERVYYDQHYHNTWNAQKLKDGTYFFNLSESHKASCNQFSNWVQVIR